jgi:hypothetical protein
VTDAEAMNAFSVLCRTEGIIPAIESAHALAGALRRPRTRPGRPAPGQPVRPRRQGRGHRVEVVRGVTADRQSPSRWPSPVSKARRGQDRAALVGYLPAGFPTVDGAIEAALAMAEAGADIIEIGLPYSDPLMDGPVIAEAVHRALTGGSGSPTCCAPSRRWPRPASRSWS